MKKFLYSVVILLCACTGVRVSYDHDPAVDFNKYTTYEYRADMDTGLSDLDNRRLITLMDSTLLNKGFVRDASEADLIIEIRSAVYRQPRQNTVGVGIGGTGRNVGGGVSVGIPLAGADYDREIVFSFRERKTSSLVWQAVSESKFNEDARPVDREMILRKVVLKVFDGFPPVKD